MRRIDAEKLSRRATKKRLAAMYVELHEATRLLAASHADLLASARKGDGSTPDLDWSSSIEASARFVLATQETDHG